MRTNCPDCVWVTTHGGKVVQAFRPCDVCRKDTLHDTRVDVRRIDGDRWVWPVYSYYCHRCSKDMRTRAYQPNREFPDLGDFDVGEETNNEATILFSGGYGSFIDDLGELPSVRICHECAHELCEWIGIDPRLWHTHSGWGGQHPDHHDDTLKE